MAFDAYRKWLGISSKRRPPTYYDLLAIEPGESDHDVIVSAIQQRRSFIRTKIGEGYDGQVRVILGQFDEAASTLLVPEFKNAYDRQLGLHRKRKFGGRRSYVLPTWMESRIVRIYGEGSGILFDAFGIVSIIAVAIAIMVMSGLWLKTQTTESESSTEPTWLERAAVPTEKETEVPGSPAGAIAPTDKLIEGSPTDKDVASVDNKTKDQQVPSEKSAEADPKLGSSPAKPLPQALQSKTTAMEFVLLPSGTFTMGSSEFEVGRDASETRHEVTLSRKFYMGKYEVTQAEFEQVMGFNPSKFTDSPYLPVENVTWFDAVGLCNKLSELDGYQACYQIDKVEKDGDSIKSAEVVLIPGATGYRLPTEAEWEYACRAGTTTAFSFGDNVKTYQVNYDGKSPYNGAAEGTRRQKPIEIDAMKANAWGLSQMHGNVWEWCQDWRGKYDSGPISDPLGPSTGSVRVGRGGTWNFSATQCRSAQRIHSLPSGRDGNLGFRVALVPPTELPSGNSPAIARGAQSSTYPISSLVEAKHSQDNDWHTAKVIENWESLHLCQYAKLSSEFNEWVTPERIRPLLAGEWLGNWQNSANEKGEDKFSVKQNAKDEIMGVWSGNTQIKGQRMGLSVIYFEGVNKQRQYQCVGFLQGDSLRLEYLGHTPQGERYYGWSELKKTDVNGKVANANKLLAVPQQARRSFTGSWTGTSVNSKSGTGPQKLTLTEKDDLIVGDWSDAQAKGMRIGNNSFIIEARGKRLYKAVGRFEQNRLMLYYTAESKDERYWGISTLTAK